MKTMINIILWFEASPLRILHLFCYLLGLLALAHVVDAQVALARMLTGN